MTLLISFRRKSSLEQSWPEASWKVTSLGFKFKTYEFIFKQTLVTLKFMIASKSLKMGSKMYVLKARSLSVLLFVDHFLVFLLKKFSPQSLKFISILHKVSTSYYMTSNLQ